jgi:chromosome segregation ATPase
MVCKMVKRGVLGAALGAGALALLFGTAAPSYVKTAFHGVRQSVKDGVPPEFQVQRAKQQLADLTPAILKCSENVARADVKVEKLQEEILAGRADLDRQAKSIVALREKLDTNEQLASQSAPSKGRVKVELARRYDRYKAAQKVLADKEQTLELRKKAVEAARDQLSNMLAAREALKVKIEGIETKLNQVRAAEAASEVSIDDSALARLKETVSDLEEQVEVMDRVTAAQQKLVDVPQESLVEDRDIASEVDAEFGQPAPAPAVAGEKPL